jgi:hypothetical protein
MALWKDHGMQVVGNERLPPEHGGASERSQSTSATQVQTAQRLIDAALALGFDPDFLMTAIEDKLSEIKRRPIGNRLTESQKAYLIQSGAFEQGEFLRIEQDVNSGSLNRQVIRTWLMRILDTVGIDEACELLERDEASILADIERRRVCAVEVSGQLRFPQWQFDTRSPEKLIPHLDDILEASTARWDWQTLSAFMETPQEDLISTGRQTPVDWLRSGGAINRVVQTIEASDWS